MREDRQPNGPGTEDQQVAGGGREQGWTDPAPAAPVEIRDQQGRQRVRKQVPPRRPKKMSDSPRAGNAGSEHRQSRRSLTQVRQQSAPRPARRQQQAQDQNRERLQ